MLRLSLKKFMSPKSLEIITSIKYESKVTEHKQSEMTPRREIKVSSLVFEAAPLLLIDSIHFMFMNNYLTSSIFAV